MTILWIYNQPLRPEAGGTERITALVARGLTRRGHRCLGILQFTEGSDAMEWQGEAVTDVYGFLKAHKVDVVINQIAYQTWLLDAFLERGGEQWRREGGRLISCLHFDPKNPSLAYMLGCNRHKSLVNWICWLKARLLHRHYARLQRQEEGRVYNHIYEHSDAFVTLSATHFPYLRRVMQRADDSHLVAINNPLTFEDIATPDSLQEKKKVLLVCARMSEYHKRISLVLRTWERLQVSCPAAADWTLKLVGDGPELESYREYARKRQIPRVQFEGQQSPEPYYREAAILLVTSSAEGWGLNITEGLQRGVVPIAMDSSPVFRDMIEDGSNGFLVPDGDMETFCARIAGLMVDASLREELARRALASATRFCMESTMDKWEAALSLSKIDQP